MTRLRELAGALLLLVVLGVRQLVYPARGVTYPGRHRVHRGHLSTMQERAFLASAQKAEEVSIDIHKHGSMTLAQREPGKALNELPGSPATSLLALRPVAYDDSDAAVELVLTRLRGWDTDDLYAAVP